MCLKKLPVLIWIVAAAVLPAGCRKPPPRPNAPRPRIVSFSPAITQILFDMALADHLVGVTTQCVLPPGQRRRTVGDTLKMEAEAILAAEPDLLLAQARLDGFEAVQKADPNIQIEHFTIESLEDIASAVERIGKLTSKPQLACDAKARFVDRCRTVGRRTAGLARRRVLFVIGYKNPLAAGSGTFIDEMIHLAGGQNAGAPPVPHLRWRAMDIESIQLAAPDVLICQADAATEQAAMEYFRSVPDLPAAGTGRIFVVTDRRWTIPSTYSAVLLSQLADMIHPEIPGKGAGR